MLKLFLNTLKTVRSIVSLVGQEALRLEGFGFACGCPGFNPVLTSGLDLFPVVYHALKIVNWLPPASWGS